MAKIDCDIHLCPDDFLYFPYDLSRNLRGNAFTGWNNMHKKRIGSSLMYLVGSNSLHMLGNGI